jgi:hypothetical protein
MSEECDTNYGNRNNKNPRIEGLYLIG